MKIFGAGRSVASSTATQETAGWLVYDNANLNQVSVGLLYAGADAPMAPAVSFDMTDWEISGDHRPRFTYTLTIPARASRSLLTFWAIDAPADAGTSFYRQRLADGRPGGNRVVEPHANLVDALGTRFVPPDSFVEDVRVPNRFNRLLVYSAARVHSATAYFGTELADARMASVFFWMA